MDAKVYVGGLPNDATSQEIEDVFYRFGRIRKVWVARRPPGFAFIEFEDVRDAEDAVRSMDGSRICGARARVELSHGKRRNDRGGGGYSGSRGRSRSRSRSPYRGSRRSRTRSHTRSRTPENRRDDRKSNSRSRTRSPAARSRSPSPTN